MFSDLRWELIARFVDIGEIVDHRRLKILFINLLKLHVIKATAETVSYVLFHGIYSQACI